MTQNEIQYLNELSNQAFESMPQLSTGMVEVKVLSLHIMSLPPGTVICEHEHPHYEIACIQEGASDTYVDAEKIHCTPENGKLFIVPPAVLHHRKFGNSEVDNANLTFVLMFNGTSAQGDIICRMLPEIIQEHKYCLTMNPELRQVMTLLKRQVHAERESACKLIGQLGYLFLSLLFQIHLPELYMSELSNRIKRSYSFDFDRVNAIKMAIEYRLNTKHGLNRLEDEFGLSRRHLNRIFQAETNMTIKQYYLRKKQEIAENLLYCGDKSIGDISAALGFRSPAMFSAFFKKNNNCSPGEYRKKHLNSQNTFL